MLIREAIPYLAFRTAARGMSAEAQNQKELLVKHGLIDSVLQNLAQTLDEFDQVVEQGTEARRAHVGASAELDSIAEELVQVVRLMDGTSRYRFEADPDSLAKWESARATFAPQRGSNDVPPSPSAGGEIKPAA